MLMIDYAKETDRGMGCLLQEHDALEVISEKTQS